MSVTQAAIVRPETKSPMRLDINLRALAPELISYKCELSVLINAIERSQHCADAVLRFANIRRQESDSAIENVRHAIIFLGLIDVKHFLFAYLMLDTVNADRISQARLLRRARLTSTLFATNGPLNKDLVFIATLLTSRKLLRIEQISDAWQLFNMNDDQSMAIYNLTHGLRETLKKTLHIENRADPRSDQLGFLKPEHQKMHEEAHLWASAAASALSR